MTFISRLLKVLGVVVLLAVVALIALTNPRPHDTDAIKAFAHQLYAFGSVRYVHELDSDHISANQALFDRVAAGEPLDVTDSCTYRAAYWLVLQDYAGRFQLADDDLHMATDFGAEHTNNCEGEGITGHHDLHDVSAAQNFAQLVSHLDELEAGAGWFRSILLINEANKNLVDLTVHFAPATHSIGVMDPDFAQEGRLSDPYNAMQSAFKAAQFAPVNSDDFWTEVDTALAAYAEIVSAAQDVTMNHSNALQRRIAGRWLSLQTVAPRLDVNDCARLRPNPVVPVC